MSNKGDQLGNSINVSGSGAAANDGGVAAGAGGAAVRGDVHGPVIIAGEGAHVTVTVQGESLRDKELAYLNGLLADYDYWRDHYTPLAGIAEVRAAVKDGPRLDLPMPFIPPGFEKLEEHGYGERVEVRRVPVDDLRTAVAEHQRIILLGEPGSGKTTTLWRLVYEYATTAQADGRAPLPVLVPLGGYTEDIPFDDYLARYLGPLAPYLETYRAAKRLILLLDGLNEMPQLNYPERVGHIQAVLDRQRDDIVVVTCRALDYVVKVKGLQQVEVSPLDEERIRIFLHHYLGQTAGERLFWLMAGGEEAYALWDVWQKAGGTFTEFWMAAEIPQNVYSKTTGSHDALWRRLRQEKPPLLAIGGNPYMLLIIAQVYAAKGALPANRARLFRAFVDVLLAREQQRRPTGWIEAEAQHDALAALAYAMQVERGRGTTVEREWAVAQLAQVAPGIDPERLLYLTSSATLLDTTITAVRFYHQLLQEYFAAHELGQQIAAGVDLQRYWPAEHWWEPSGWEETVILLAGMEADATNLFHKLTPFNPILAGRCLLEGDAQADQTTKQVIVNTLIDRMRDASQPPKARTMAGDTLAQLGDPRPGVGLRPDGLPDIIWCEVPAGPFLMGSDKRKDPQARDGEFPQHSVTLPAFRISQYPVTNAQYAAFVRDGGYTEKWRRCWTKAGWQWKGGRSEPYKFGGVFDLPNHPVVAVTWYEAIAFCGWLTKRLRQTGELGPNEEVTLPSERQWEKAARGTEGRIYPWGDGADPNRANYDETEIGSTSAVGCFPGGVSPYRCEEMSGNVWEWCRTKPEANYQNYQDDNDLEGDAGRVWRGGSFFRIQNGARCGKRSWDNPDVRLNNLGFRLVVSPIL